MNVVYLSLLLVLLASKYGVHGQGGLLSGIEEIRDEGDRPAVGDRPSEGDRPAVGDRPAEGDRPAVGDRPAEDEGGEDCDRDEPFEVGNIRCSSNCIGRDFCRNPSLVALVTDGNVEICDSWISANFCRESVTRCDQRARLNAQCGVETNRPDLSSLSQMNEGDRQDIIDNSGDDRATSVAAYVLVATEIRGRGENNEYRAESLSDSTLSVAVTTCSRADDVLTMMPNIDLSNTDDIEEINNMAASARRVTRRGLANAVMDTIGESDDASMILRNLEPSIRLSIDNNQFEDLIEEAGSTSSSALDVCKSMFYSHGSEDSNELRLTKLKAKLCATTLMLFVNDGNDFSTTDVSEFPVESFSMLTSSDLDTIRSVNRDAAVAVCESVADFRYQPCYGANHVRLDFATKCLSFENIDLTATAEITEVRDEVKPYLFHVVKSGDFSEFLARFSNQLLCDSTGKMGLPYQYGDSVLSELRSIITECVVDDIENGATLIDRYDCAWLLEVKNEMELNPQHSQALLSVDTALSANCISRISEDIVIDRPVVMCTRIELTQEQSEDIDQRINERSQRHTELVTSQNAEARRRRRRRRNATAYTCDTIESLITSEVKTVLTAENINAMDQTEFSACLSYLSELTGWSAEQYRSLLLQTMELYSINDHCIISSADVSAMGSIVQGLTADEIICNTDIINNIAYFGSYSDWSDTQLNALATTYMDASGTSHSSDFTYIDLSFLQHAVCGLSNGEIAAIPAAEYMDAASILNELETTSTECLFALASLATQVDAYGPVSDWTYTDFEDVGVILGGLSADELNSADADSIQVWGERIALIDPVVFASLTVDTLSQIDREDLAHITDEQKEELSTEQLNALMTAAGSDVVYNVEDGENGSERFRTEYLFTVVVTFVAKMMF